MPIATNRGSQCGSLEKEPLLLCAAALETLAFEKCLQLLFHAYMFLDVTTLMQYVMRSRAQSAQSRDLIACYVMLCCRLIAVIERQFLVLDTQNN